MNQSDPTTTQEVPADNLASTHLPKNGRVIETLGGDRLCMKCMHPLVGSAIERDHATGLLHVRCGECGTASALFEYPTVGPWLARMKTVAVASILVLLVGVVLATAAITGGFSAGAANATCESASEALARHYRDLNGATEDAPWGIGWATADSTWLDSDVGRAELSALRTSPAALLPLGGFVLIGAVILTPFVFFLAVAAMRRAMALRAIACALVAGAGGILAMLADGLFAPLGAGIRPTWLDVVEREHMLFFYAVAIGALMTWAALIGAIAPAAAAAAARFMLPPRDRRLVAWLWEWRGEAVPRG
jgi:hypothetical protein